MRNIICRVLSIFHNHAHFGTSVSSYCPSSLYSKALQFEIKFGFILSEKDLLATAELPIIPDSG